DHGRPLMHALLAALLFLTAPATQVPVSREGSVKRELLVGRVEIDAYVTSASGEPIPDLLASDFRVEIDGRTVPLESVERIPADRSEGAPSASPAPEAPTTSEAAPSGPRYPPGRLLVFFFQSDFQRARLTGLMRMVRQARLLVDDLLPTD